MRKAIAASFTLSDLLAYLQQDDKAPEGFATTREWAEHLEVRPGKLSKLMIEAKRAGVLEVSRDRRERLDGVMTPVPVYRFNVEERNGKDTS